MIRSVTLLGSSSGRNAGDAAIVSGIMDSLDLAFGQKLRYEIPTIKPGFITNAYENDTHPISMLPWSGSIKMLGLPTLRSILNTDLTLIFDAILFDRSLYNPLFNYLSTLRVLLPYARKRGTKIGLFNVGVGPIDTAAGAAMLKEVVRCADFVTLRDDASLSLLNKLGIQHPYTALTADSALNLAPCSRTRARTILNELGFPSDREILGINVSAYLDSWAIAGRPSMGKARFLEMYSEALNIALKEIDAPLLFIATQHHDVPLTKELMDRVATRNHKALMANIEHSHYEVKGVLGEIGLLCAMRLHASILASSALTPVIALPHQPKVAHFFQTLGIGEHVVTFDRCTAQSLAELFIRGWKARREIRAQLERVIPEKQQAAHQSAHLVKALSDGKSIADAFSIFEAGAPRKTAAGS